MSVAPAPQPMEYQDGFTIRTMIGAVFVGVVMMPGSIYLALVAGSGLGPAAQWVTIILFTEIARRSFTTLKRQEVYLLYYMASVLAIAGGPLLIGGPYGAMMFHQYLAQSPQAIALGIADQLPDWVVPNRLSPAITGRNLLDSAWYVPLMLATFLWIIGRMTSLTVGYALFRITSDIEQLDFPLAPIAAEGATALAETTSKEETWRWNIFSVGAALGLAFGAIYVGVPGFTGVLFSKPLQVIPIPFIDLTKSAHHVLPASLAGISLDLGSAIFGMVLPYAMVAGLFVASVATAFVLNPVLYKLGFFPNWKPGMSLIPTKLAIDFDLWMSVGIGASLCVAFLGFYNVVKMLRAPRGKSSNRSLLEVPKGRGDIGLHWCLLVYVVGVTVSIVLCKVLLKGDFPFGILLAYALLITPAISYVSARMIGITGRPVPFPFLREGTIILSGYKGVDIWFAPLPLADYGMSTQMFRELALTRTKFSSLVKLELFMLPISIVCGLLFLTFFWRIEAIPSATYPFTAKMWPLQATYSCLFMTATSDTGSNWLMEAIRLKYVLGGLGLGFGLFGLTSLIGLPSLFFYGMIGGLGAIPNVFIPMFVGAVIGKRVFAKRFGEETWRRYTPVLAAGYSCGVGLIGMLSVAFAMVARSVSSLPF
ncbi:MAG TPA: peptide transporter [Candidatus Hydrogenedentes bacterium]|nr:peptide transporter [Candidatus Hydrogenedentota bacterium]